MLKKKWLKIVGLGILTGILCWYSFVSICQATGNDLFTGGTVDSSGQMYGVDDNAFDNVIGTSWFTDGIGSWLQYDLNYVQDRGSCVLWLKPWGDGGGLGTKDFTIYTSSDGSGWTAVYSGIKSNDSGFENFNVEIGTCRFVRIAVDSNWRPGNPTVGIDELDLVPIESNSAETVAFPFLGISLVLVLLIISLWRQSGVLFLITALATLLLGVLGILQTWELIVLFLIGITSLITGTIKIMQGDF